MKANQKLLAGSSCIFEIDLLPISCLKKVRVITIFHVLGNYDYVSFMI